jgi:hypothetical protein
MRKYALVYRIRNQLFVVPSDRYGATTESTIRAINAAARYFSEGDEGEFHPASITGAEYVGTAQVAKED